jgi:hypothetical protein
MICQRRIHDATWVPQCKLSKEKVDAGGRQGVWLERRDAAKARSAALCDRRGLQGRNVGRYA